MNLSDVLKNVNTFIGDSSTDRISAEDRYQACTEATAWLLEELGNEHMTDRTEIEYLPTVMWYKMSNLTPYLLTAGQLRFKEKDDHEDFTRVEPRELARNTGYNHMYAIEQYNGDAYLGVAIPDAEQGTYQELIQINKNDGLTYSGINAENIVEEEDAVRFDMDSAGQTATGLTTTTDPIDISKYEGTGIIIFEVELSDVDDVNSVSIKFGSDLSTDYYLGTVTQDINGNTLVEGVNTIKVAMSELTTVGSPDNSSVTEWGFQINHDSGKALADNFRFSDLRIAEPIYLTFKYIFYRVGKDSSGSDIIEFGDETDVPFFVGRYPQYRFAVAHMAASTLFKSMQDYASAGSEAADARRSLERYRKNFSVERDMSNSAFRPAGVNFRGRRIRNRMNYYGTKNN